MLKNMKKIRQLKRTFFALIGAIGATNLESGHNDYLPYEKMVNWAWNNFRRNID